MSDDVPPPARSVRFKKDGTPDGRGHADGSHGTRFGSGDGRRRPGRPKRSRDERTDVLAVRDMVVTYGPPGRQRKANTRQAILLKQRELALKGNQRAIEWLDRKIAQYDPPSADPDRTAALCAEDEEILLIARGRGLLDADDRSAVPGASAPDGIVPPPHRTDEPGSA
jgi:hypothetical protein